MRRSVFLLAPLLLLATAWAAPPARSGFFTTSDGVRLHYLEAGKGPAIVFVPGWTMPAWIWEKQIQHFAEYHRVIALDLRSQGESGKPADGNYPERRAQDIQELIEHLKLKPAVLVGWSLAVPDVLTYAERFGGDDIRAYVLVDGFAWDKLDPQFVGAMLNSYRQLQSSRPAFTEKFVRSMYKKPVTEGYIRRLVEASLETPTNSAITMSVSSIARADWRAAIAKLDRPVLIACEAGLKNMAADPIQSVVPSARVELFEDAGHALFVDDADRFDAVLDDFLAHLPPGQM